MARLVRAVLVGFGKTNQAVLELALTRPWLEVVAIVVRSPEREREAASKRVAGAPAELRCSTDLIGTIRTTYPDVAVVATSTHLVDVLPVLAAVASTGTPIVCTAEDLAFIRSGDSEAADRIIELASTHRIPIVATGANPGFVLDVWPLTLSGLAWDVQGLRARRVVDVSEFGPRVRSSLGIDLAPDAFRVGIADGTVVGHAGFPESLRILASSMGRELERIEVVSEPILADPTADPARWRRGHAGTNSRRGATSHRLVRRSAMARHLDDPARRPDRGRPVTGGRDRARGQTQPQGPCGARLPGVAVHGRHDRQRTPAGHRSTARSPSPG